MNNFQNVRYEYNTDRDLVQLMFYDSDGVPLGLLNWYVIDFDFFDRLVIILNHILGMLFTQLQ